MDFKQAKTYDDLLEANQRFIKGELKKTPYHYGPLHADSKTLMPKLLKLHTDARLFTIDGQAGSAGCETLNAVWGGGKRAQYKQKPYLNFYAERGQYLDALLRYLKEQSDILLFVHDMNGLVFSNLYGNNKLYQKGPWVRVPVTLERSAQSDEELPEAQWQDITGIQYKAKWNVFCMDLSGSMKRIMNNSNFVRVEVLVDRWCSKKSVEDYILDFMSQYGPRTLEDSDEEDLCDVANAAEGREGCGIQ